MRWSESIVIFDNFSMLFAWLGPLLLVACIAVTTGGVELLMQENAEWGWQAVLEFAHAALWTILGWFLGLMMTLAPRRRIEIDPHRSALIIRSGPGLLWFKREKSLEQNRTITVSPHDRWFIVFIGSTEIPLIRGFRGTGRLLRPFRVALRAAAALQQNLQWNGEIPRGYSDQDASIQKIRSLGSIQPVSSTDIQSNGRAPLVLSWREAAAALQRNDIEVRADLANPERGQRNARIALALAVANFFCFLTAPTIIVSALLARSELLTAKDEGASSPASPPSGDDRVPGLSLANLALVLGGLQALVLLAGLVAIIADDWGLKQGQ